MTQTRTKKPAADVVQLLHDVAKARGWYKMQTDKGKVPGVVVKALNAGLLAQCKRRGPSRLTIVHPDTGAPVQYLNLTPAGKEALIMDSFKPMQST